MKKCYSISLTILIFMCLMGGTAFAIEVTERWLHAKPGQWRQYTYDGSTITTEKVLYVTGSGENMAITIEYVDYSAKANATSRREMTITGEYILKVAVGVNQDPVREEKVTLPNGVTVNCKVYSMKRIGFTEELYVSDQVPASGVVYLKNADSDLIAIKLLDFGN